MARPLRVEFPGALYLVTARALPRQRLTRDEAETRDFLSRFQDLSDTFGAVFHGFCLLPSHYHVLVETPGGNLSRVIHRLNAGYTATVNSGRRRKGPLLQSRYRSLLLGEEWLVPLSIHVHLNPVRLGLVAAPVDYLGSSARGYRPGSRPVAGLETSRVTRLAGGPHTYAERLAAALADPPAPPWRQVWRQTVLGGEELRRRVLQAVEGRDPREIPGFSRARSGPTIDAVLALVAEQTGLGPKQITGGKFQRVLARKVAIHLARRFTGLTLREIGQVFGVDYTTVHMVGRRLEVLRAEDPSLDEFVTNLEEELRRRTEMPPPAGSEGVKSGSGARKTAKKAAGASKGAGQLTLF